MFSSLKSWYSRMMAHESGADIFIPEQREPTLIAVAVTDDYGSIRTVIMRLEAYQATR